MKSTKLSNRIVSLIFSFVLIAAMGIMISACGQEEIESPKNPISSSADASNNTSSTQKYLDDYGNAAKNIGNVKAAKNQFIFKMTDHEGYTYIYRVFTDKTNIGEALSDLNLINGEEGQYGLFVTTVNGKEAMENYAWMLYINGEQAMTGVDNVTLAEKTEYEFRLESFK